jgi:hypothetical protein
MQDTNNAKFPINENSEFISWIEVGRLTRDINDFGRRMASGESRQHYFFRQNATPIQLKKLPRSGLASHYPFGEKAENEYALSLD